MAIAANLLVIALEAVGLYISASAKKWRILAFYTQLSNLCALLSSAVFLCAQGSAAATALRYLSSCMLTMTFLITTLVLVPMGGGAKRLLLSGNGPYHHVLCPILSVASYLAWEPRIADPRLIALPGFLTLAYGGVMLYLNAARIYDGPYPFFRVYNQSRAATALWMAALLALISGIGYALYVA